MPHSPIKQQHHHDLYTQEVVTALNAQGARGFYLPESVGPDLSESKARNF